MDLSISGEGVRGCLWVCCGGSESLVRVVASQMLELESYSG